MSSGRPTPPFGNASAAPFVSIAAMASGHVASSAPAEAQCEEDERSARQARKSGCGAAERAALGTVVSALDPVGEGEQGGD